MFVLASRVSQPPGAGSGITYSHPPAPCLHPVQGGSDILHELHQKGELKQMLEGAKQAQD